MSSSVYLAVPVMMILAIAQTAVLPHFPIYGLVPQLPLLVAISWGLLRGVDEGVLWGFVAGLLLDLFSVSPMGLTSLAFMVAILIVTWIDVALPTSRVFLPMLLAALATLIYLLLYFLGLQLLGRPVSFQSVTALPGVVLLHGGLVLPVYWLMYAIHRTIRPRRVEI